MQNSSNSNSGLPGLDTVSTISFDDTKSFAEKLKQENRKSAAILIEDMSNLTPESALETLNKNRQLLDGLYEDAIRQASGQKPLYDWDFDNMNVQLSWTDIEILTGAKDIYQFMNLVSSMSSINMITLFDHTIVFKLIDILYVDKSNGDACIAFPSGIETAIYEASVRNYS